MVTMPRLSEAAVTGTTADVLPDLPAPADVQPCPTIECPPSMTARLDAVLAHHHEWTLTASTAEGETITCPCGVTAVYYTDGYSVMWRTS